MVDAHALGACGRDRAGSNPPFPTKHNKDIPMRLPSDPDGYTPEQRMGVNRYMMISAVKTTTHQLDNWHDQIGMRGVVYTEERSEMALTQLGRESWLMVRNGIDEFYSTTT